MYCPRIIDPEIFNIENQVKDELKWIIQSCNLDIFGSYELTFKGELPIYLTLEIRYLDGSKKYTTYSQVKPTIILVTPGTEIHFHYSCGLSERIL